MGLAIMVLASEADSALRRLYCAAAVSRGQVAVFQSLPLRVPAQTLRGNGQAGMPNQALMRNVKIP